MTRLTRDQLIDSLAGHRLPARVLQKTMEEILADSSDEESDEVEAEEDEARFSVSLYPSSYPRLQAVLASAQLKGRQPTFLLGEEPIPCTMYKGSMPTTSTRATRLISPMQQLSISV